MSSNGLPPNPSRAVEHSPPPPPRRIEEDRDRFSRSNFAPIPNRHEDLNGGSDTGPGYSGNGGGQGYRPGTDRYIPSSSPPPRREPLPLRERDIAQGIPPPRRGEEYDADISRWERRLDRESNGREEWDERGRRGPYWEEDFDRKRRRSPSPSFPTHRARRFSPEPLPPPGSNLPDPASLPHQLTFKQFAEWFRASHPSTAKADEEEFRRWKEGGETGEKGRVGMGKRYERYRKEYTSRQLYSLYLMHRSSPWFTERYSHLPEDVAERKRVYRQGRIPTMEKYVSELKEGKHDNVSFDQPEPPETDMDKALGEDEVGRIEVAPKSNQVFVKSVPPTISRKELEQLFGQCDGFEYLALTEPSVKKSFHRVAWAQYSSETDIHAVVRKLDASKIDNFTFHMGVNTAPTVGRIRYAPPNASLPARLARDAEKAKAMAEMLEEGLLDDEERGSVVVQQVLDRLLETAEDKAKTTLDHWISYLRQALSTCYYCVAPMSFPEEIQRKCIGHLRSPLTDSPPANAEGTDRPGEEEDERDIPESTMDRRSRGKEEGRGREGKDERWEEGLEARLEMFLGGGEVGDHGGRDIEEETKRLTAPMIKQEEENKYRCKECNKLFKAPEFVMKHITVKHGEGIQAKLDELSTFNNFVSDPQHLQPTPQIPAAIDDALPQLSLNPNPLATSDPQQQMMLMMMQMQQAMMMQMQQQQQGTGLAGRLGGYAGGEQVAREPLPAVPAGAEDPRAKRGRVSYMDLDEVGGGAEGGLPY